MVKSYPGAPVVTTITTDIDSGDTSIPIAASDGWITGAGGKPFVVRVHEGTTFEKILCTRSGLTLTAVTRGFDGTTPTNFSSGSTIKCVWDADSATEFVEHIDGTETDPHATTLLNENRHADAGLHEFGAALGTPGTPVGVGTAAGAGTGTVPARSDHAHVLTSAVAGAGLDLDGGVLEVVVDDTTLAISGDSLLVKDGGISGAKLASQAVTTAKIAPDAITGGLIADDALDSEHYVDGSVDPVHLAASLPRGYVAHKTRGTDTGSISSLADVSGMTTDAETVAADRYVRVKVNLIVSYEDVSDAAEMAAIRVLLYEGSTELKRSILQLGREGNTTHDAQCEFVYLTAGATSRTWKVGVEPMTYADSVIIKDDSQIYVEDIGGA